MISKIKEIVNRLNVIEEKLASREAIENKEVMENLGREYRSLKKNMPIYRKYIDTVKNIEDTRLLLANENDQDLLTIAREEIAVLEKELPELEEKVRYLLVPRDPNDSRNAIVEIRAGTGGIEAGIFGGDLFRMYTHYIESKCWKYEILNSSFGEMDSIKEITFNVTGEDVYGTLKFESGIHRVQRVPQTEAQGRIHTSAASVAVFPEVDEVEFHIDPSELRIDVFRAGGKGGQHVNKTESAVRIVHLPTGITVQCQDEKSQIKNRARAMKILTSRIMDAKLSEKQAQESAFRKNMVGSGDRSEKIRTYNFPQNRLTDHRINLTLYKLDAVMNGDLQDIIDALNKADLDSRLQTNN
jgi:peptide chain release factor 1